MMTLGRRTFTLGLKDIETESLWCLVTIQDSKCRVEVGEAWGEHSEWRMQQRLLLWVYTSSNRDAHGNELLGWTFVPSEVFGGCIPFTYCEPKHVEMEEPNLGSISNYRLTDFSSWGSSLIWIPSWSLWHTSPALGFPSWKSMTCMFLGSGFHKQGLMIDIWWLMICLIWADQPLIHLSPRLNDCMTRGRYKSYTPSSTWALLFSPLHLGSSRLCVAGRAVAYGNLAIKKDVRCLSLETSFSMFILNSYLYFFPFYWHTIWDNPNILKQTYLWVENQIYRNMVQHPKWEYLFQLMTMNLG